MQNIRRLARGESNRLPVAPVTSRVLGRVSPCQAGNSGSARPTRSRVSRDGPAPGEHQRLEQLRRQLARAAGATPCSPAAASAWSGCRPRKTASAPRASAVSTSRPGPHAAVDVHLGVPGHRRGHPGQGVARAHGAVQLAAAVVGHPDRGGARVDAPPGVVGAEHALDHDREPGDLGAASRCRPPTGRAPRRRRPRVRRAGSCTGARTGRRRPSRGSATAYLVPTTGVSAVSTTAPAPASTAARERRLGERAVRR